MIDSCDRRQQRDFPQRRGFLNSSERRCALTWRWRGGCAREGSVRRGGPSSSSSCSAPSTRARRTATTPARSAPKIGWTYARICARWMANGRTRARSSATRGRATATTGASNHWKGKDSAPTPTRRTTSNLSPSSTSSTACAPIDYKIASPSRSSPTRSSPPSGTRPRSPPGSPASPSPCSATDSCTPAAATTKAPASPSPGSRWSDGRSKPAGGSFRPRRWRPTGPCTSDAPTGSCTVSSAAASSSGSTQPAGPSSPPPPSVTPSAATPPSSWGGTTGRYTRCPPITAPVSGNTSDRGCTSTAGGSSRRRGPSSHPRRSRPRV